MTEPPSDRPARTEDEQTRRIAATGVGIGCTTFILGGALFAVAAIIARGRPEPYTTTLGTIGAIAVGVGLAVTIGTGAFMNRRSRRAMRGLAIGRPIDPDIETIRRIESARLPATAEWSKFPTGLQVTREIDNGGTPIRFAANVPSLRPREKNKPMEIASSYIWFPIPVHLPRIIVGPDSAALRKMSRDVDIESDDFNRRYRVTPGLDPDSKINHAEFARYASAIVHPRAAQCLLRLPQGSPPSSTAISAARSTRR